MSDKTKIEDLNFIERRVYHLGESRVVEQGRQYVAAHSSHPRRLAEHTGAGHPLREHGKEEVGVKLGLHGDLCLRHGNCVLGRVGFSHVLRGQACCLPRETWGCLGREVSSRASISWVLSYRNNGVFPEGFRLHNVGLDRWRASWEDEFQGLGDVRAALADMLIHDGGF
ncbi:hypothetical protein JRO89_XS04G0165400 [Xanthoceras sorbifolium]|uniref:Uncharacterized protein n=1 Tax=Xanthoceras sorbifolium TaxID=99658 RepID=A0ABQ8I5J7_9ROSI|nr:hypothetical protein JRO89_XS04G0165400 [Xanthoceras sorbifolium]